MVDPDINDWAGFYFVGVVLSAFFFGVSCAQAIFYYKEYPDDSVFLRSFVGILWAIDTGRTMMDVATLWYWAVQYHGNTTELTVISRAFTAEFFLAKVVIVIVQCYFIYVIWRFSAHGPIRHLPAILGLLFALVTFGAGLAGSAETAVNNNGIVAIPRNVVPGTLVPAAAFLTDVYLTSCLCILLHGHRTGLSRTENMITRLVTYTVGRGILTALFQIVSCVTFAIFTQKLSTPWALVFLPGNAVYLNSLLTALNTRHHVRDRDAEYGLGIELPGLSFPDMRSGDIVTSAAPIRDAFAMPSRQSLTHT